MNKFQFITTKQGVPTMTMPVRNIVASILFAMIGIGYGLLATDLPDQGSTNVPGADFFPQIIASFIVILSISIFYTSVTEFRAGRGETGEDVFTLKSVGIIIWLGVFIFSLPYLGFLITAVPFFAGLMMLCQAKRMLLGLIGAVVIPVFLYFVFRDGFNILLPEAQWM